MPISLTPAAAERVRTFMASRGTGRRVAPRRQADRAARAMPTSSAMPTKSAPATSCSRPRASRSSSMPTACKFVDGTEIDFVRQGLNEAFKFRNPERQGRVRLRRELQRLTARRGLNFLGRRGPAGYTARVTFSRLAPPGPALARVSGFRGRFVTAGRLACRAIIPEDPHGPRTHAFHRQARWRPQERHRRRLPPLRKGRPAHRRGPHDAA